MTPSQTPSRLSAVVVLSVETLEGEGFVAVKKADKHLIRKSGQGASKPVKRRGRQPTRQEQDASEIASLQDRAVGEG